MFLIEKLDLHLKNCKSKLSNCKYCELLVAKDSLKNHEYECGSRTDHCLKCLKLVKIRELEVHNKFLCDKQINK